MSYELDEDERKREKRPQIKMLRKKQVDAYIEEILKYNSVHNLVKKVIKGTNLQRRHS